MITALTFYGALGVLALRLVLAAVLLVHGWSKLANRAGTAEWFQSIGFKPGMFWGMLAAILEFLGGVAFGAGILVQPFAFALAGQFVVIIAWRLKTKQKFVHGWEIDLLMLGGCIALLFIGAGLYSFDRMFIF